MKTIFFLRKRQFRMFKPSWSYYIVNYYSSSALLMCIHPLEENVTCLTTLRIKNVYYRIFWQHVVKRHEKVGTAFFSLNLLPGNLF